MNLASDFEWLLWAVPMGMALLVALGWWLRGLEQKQWKQGSHSSPQAYFRGLNHLLNERQDEAIDAFIEAVQQDPETTELHFALGSLFRRRGDYDRSIRVHEHLIKRGDLKLSERQRAQFSLAQDFLKAGLLDRADEALLALINTPLESSARLAMLSIYERTRDWQQAIVSAQHLDGGEHGSFRSRIAHYHCELASQCQKRDDLIGAKDHLHAALHLDSKHVRAQIELAQMSYKSGQVEEALQFLERAVQRQPMCLPLIGRTLEQWVEKEPSVREKALSLLSIQPQLMPSIDVTLSRAQLQPELAKTLLTEHLSLEPSLTVASKALQLQSDGLPPHVLDAVNAAAAPLQRYRCAACGFEAHTYFWQCPGCQSWDSFPARRVEEI